MATTSAWPAYGGHQKTTRARGGAVSTCFHADQLDLEARIPNGEVWNMTYDPNAPEGHIPDIGYEELWARLKWFLEQILPVAEEAGVMMALHPDDPPMPCLRGTPRMVYQPELYQKVLDLLPSPCNGIDFCMGSIQEMTHGDIYEALEQYAAQGRIAYAHVRNVRGKVPDYTEVFVDDGDIDIRRTLEILHKHHFDGGADPRPHAAAPVRRPLARGHGLCAGLYPRPADGPAGRLRPEKGGDCHAVV